MILIIAAMFSRDAQEREKRRGLTVHLIYTSLQGAQESPRQQQRQPLTYSFIRKTDI